MIDFDLERTRHLRALYNEATSKGQTEFTFCGHTLLVSYAKYLLEYLEAIYETQARGETH